MPLRPANPQHDADFTHGTEAGWEHRCRCASCTRAKATADNARATRRVLLDGDPGNEPLALVLVEPQLAALRAAVPDLTDADVALAVGVADRRAIRDALNGVPGHGAVLRRLARVAPADVYAATRTVPEAEVSFVVGQLAALGYPVEWQESRVGRPLAPFVRRPTTMGRAPVAALDAARLLLSATRERVATPAHGVTAEESAKASAVARAAGFHTPATYDDDGTLILNAIPGAGWERADQRAAVRLRIAATLMDADEIPTSASALALLATRTGATPFVLDKTIPVVASLLGPDGDPERLRATVAAWQTGELAPLLAALRLGLYLLTDKGLPRDHPDYLAYRDERTRERVAA
ncbi:hypothetical protein ACFCZ3_20270 [Cellulosimicrobium cellulans]|uniref:hypothetical protein n=1 Tax=Cellulosimicrobium cellulans TaxID=1710 RepID=UPI0035D70509